MTDAAMETEVLLLAGGLSRRMGEPNKLLLDFAGQPLVRHVASRIQRAGFKTICVVTGYQANEVRSALDGLPISTCFNADYETGQASSVRSGLRGLAANRPGRATGVMVCLGDMPYLEAEDYQLVAQAFETSGRKSIVVPEFAGQRGNPIVIPPAFLTEAADGALNTGCRKLIQDRPQDVAALKVENAAFVRDIDTPADYTTTLETAFPSAPCCN